jgi:hypothetical protein
MEEKYFYDILEGEAQAHKKALEAVNEHHIIEMIIKDLQRFPRDHENFAIKVESLGEYTTHHLVWMISVMMLLMIICGVKNIQRIPYGNWLNH